MGHVDKILVVDNEPQMQSLLEDFLGTLGYAVRVAGDGEQALQLLQREPFQAVLTDLKMPNVGGLELLRAIKASYPTLPTVMITGYPSVEVAVEAMKEGAADFITKPLRLDNLELVLDKLSKSPHLNGSAATASPGASSAPWVPPGGMAMARLLPGEGESKLVTHASLQQLAGLQPNYAIPTLRGLEQDWTRGKCQCCARFSPILSLISWTSWEKRTKRMPTQT
jgi:CheY-like chemotaxis protein